MAEEPAFRRGYGALRVGRSSCENADYFVTVCLQRPLTGLTDQVIGEALQLKLHELETSGFWTLRTFVIMPDHFHVVFTLAGDGDLSDVMRRFKGSLAPSLRSKDLCWQKNFYDHRMRSDEDRLPVFLYLFLNPYRAGLLRTDEKWPWYYCSRGDWEWFGGLTDASAPLPEWLQ